MASILYRVVSILWLLSSSSGEWKEQKSSDVALDLGNPIDVLPSKSSPRQPPLYPSQNSNPFVSTRLESIPKTIVLFDDNRDEARQLERERNRGKDFARNWVGGGVKLEKVVVPGSGGENRKERNVVRYGDTTAFNTQRERVVQIQRENDINRFENNRGSDFFSRPLGSGNRWSPVPFSGSNRSTNRMNPKHFGSLNQNNDAAIKDRIQRERNEEIQKEVNKALSNREHLLKVLAAEKSLRRTDSRISGASISPRSRYEEMDLETREKRRREEIIRQESIFQNGGRRVNSNRPGMLFQRRGAFDSSLERREHERRLRLSRGAGRLENNRRPEVQRHHEKFFNERDRNREIERVRGKSLDSLRNENRLRDIERRRKQEIWNEERQRGVQGPSFGVNRGGPLLQSHYQSDRKPPILIFEEVPVPIAVELVDRYDRDDSRSDRHPSRIHSPHIYISDLYDARAPGRSNHYVDRRPPRPDIRPHEGVVHVEEGFIVPDGPRFGHLPLPVPRGAHLPPVLGHPAIGPSIAALSQLERLNNIDRLNKLHQAIALSKIGQATEAAALAHAALKNQAVIQAVNNQAALVNAVHQQQQAALLSQSLLKDKFASTVIAEDQISQAQKHDFVKLVLKHGLRNALREQLSLHLRSRAEGDRLISKLQATKEDLIHRLLLLRPYFTSPGHGGFVLPAFIPNIPVGAHLSPAQIGGLPKIQLLPSTSLLSPEFRLPPEVVSGLQKEVDVGFVEHILRLPELVFREVVHMPKRDFILALFPRLYRETIADVKYNSEVHYPSPKTPHQREQYRHSHPGKPQKKGVKEHHHHHIHIHKPGHEHHQVNAKQHPPSSHQNHHVSTDIVVEHPPHQHHNSDSISHSHPHLHIHSHPHSHPNPHMSSKVHIHHEDKHSLNPDQVHILSVPHEHQDFLLPTPEHQIGFQRVAYPHAGVQLPLEESSYISYEPHPFGAQKLHAPHQNHEAQFAFHPIQLKSATPAPFFSSELQIVGINVRPKGEEGHHSATTSTVASTTLFHHDSIPSLPIQPRSDDASKDSFSFNIRNNGRSPSTSTVHPFPTTFLPTSRPFSTTFLPTSKSFSTTLSSTSRPITTDFFTTGRPITTSFPTTTQTFSTTQQPFSTTFSTFQPITTNLPFVPFLTTFSTDGNEASDTTTPPFFTSTRTSLFDSIPAIAGEVGNSLNRIPGTDSNDDEHLVSPFQKKTGNATRLYFQENASNQKERSQSLEIESVTPSNSAESVVNQVRKITNIFGEHLQDNIPVARLEESTLNFSSPIITKLFPDYPDYVDDSVTSTKPISTTTFASTKPPTNTFNLFKNPENGNKNTAFETDNTNTSLPRISSKKAPMPTRVDFRRSTAFENIFPFQGRSETDLEGEIGSRDDKAFIGGPIPGWGALPRFLRDAPPCSTGGDPPLKSFCLYPEGYDSAVAESVILSHEMDIERIVNILRQVPKPAVNLTSAEEQIPSLNLSVICDTEDRDVKLSWSRDILGSWFSILQTAPFEQEVVVTTCGESARAKGCRPLLQPRPLVAFHPSDVTRKPYVMEFPLPVGCVYTEA